jgi:hypothetical protein
MTMSLPTDEDGFLRCECPSCERQFKWWPNDTSWADAPDALTSTESYFCPYCYEVADSESWWTTEQLGYAQELLAAEFVSPSLQRLKRDIEAINSSSSFVKMTVTSPKIAYPEPLIEPNDMVRLDFPCHPEKPIKVAEGWDQDVSCLVCGIQYPVDLVRALSDEGE